MKNRLGNTALQ